MENPDWTRSPPLPLPSSPSPPSSSSSIVIYMASSSCTDFKTRSKSVS